MYGSASSASVPPPKDCPRSMITIAMDSLTGISTPSLTDDANPPTPTLVLVKPRRARLTRVERLRIRTLYDFWLVLPGHRQQLRFHPPSRPIRLHTQSNPWQAYRVPAHVLRRIGRGPSDCDRFEEQPTSDVRSKPDRSGVRLWDRINSLCAAETRIYKLSARVRAPISEEE